MQTKGIRIHCPTPGCLNRRLFDNISVVEGTIAIKCPSCNLVVSVCLDQVAKDKRHLMRYWEQVHS